MRSIEFFSGNREVVRGVLFEPAAPRRHPGIIFAHGLLSSHEEFGEYPARFCDRGYLVLAIDFRGHGTSDGMRGLISEDRMIEDLTHALDFLASQPGLDHQRIALFGHSLGGGGVICTTARDARVRAVVAGATVGRLREELGTGELVLYRVMDGVNRMQKTVTHKSLYFPYRVTYEHIYSDPQARQAAAAKGFLQRSIPVDNLPFVLKQDAIKCAKNVHVPALIVLGEKDNVVQPKSVRAVYEALAGEKELYEVIGSGHSFATDCKCDEAFDHIAVWMDAHLR
ncbi:MAG: alpha/beta hydrolase [Acidobacteriota bacterium]